MSEPSFLDSFAGLQAIFDQKTAASAMTFDEPAFERLRMALAKPGSRSPLDLAVLIRHALGYENGRRQSEDDATLRVPIGGGWPNETDWRRVGLNAQRQSPSWHVRSTGWRPDWLPGSKQQAVDRTAAMAKPVAKPFSPATSKRPLTDGFLHLVGKEAYLSTGQCRAARTLLTAPPGATILATLPTGEGKSLLFQLVDRVGFSESQGPGVTLVIVPTITLAIDHEQSARKLPLREDRLPDQPLAYVGDDARKLQIREAITAGQQGLCFVAPEAACGSLRSALLKAASVGRLRALVVDEAHLVDGWGTDFRTEFQLLGGLWAELMARSPPAQRFRTLLLSATLTPIAVQALRQLFANAKTPFFSVGALRLRPEIEFWVAPFTDVATRQQHCLEALAHVPRPAILYTTTVRDAEIWGDDLKQWGYRSLRVVTGNTNAQDRERILAAWRDGDIDLVVATAAFGMGVDYANVRTVVHACIPETLDRFYQEVGRSGRDGCASLSLLLPAHDDRQMAYSLNQQTIISVDRGLTRWRAMFDNSRLGRDPHERIINLNTPPTLLPGDIDMLGIRNADWNARTLALMARAGLIRLQGSVLQTEVSAEQITEVLAGYLQRVYLIDDSHYLRERWQQTIEPLRQNIYQVSSDSLQKMLSILCRENCVAQVVADLYTMQLNGNTHHVALVCGGCPWCRENPTERIPAESTHLLPLPQPYSRGLRPPTVTLFDSRRIALVFYQRDELTSRRNQRRLADAIEQLVIQGLTRFIGIGGGLIPLRSIFQERLTDRILFFAEIDEVLQLPTLDDIPSGPELLIVGETHNIRLETLSQRPPNQERLIFVSNDQADPSMPQRRLIDIHAIPGYPLEDFIRRVLS
ncbi:MAG: protein DpdF [Candidatus Contendobacter sp.]|nr:protein DpdF [Candidatus Contendobacter sp.]